MSKTEPAAGGNPFAYPRRIRPWAVPACPLAVSRTGKPRGTYTHYQTRMRSRSGVRQDSPHRGQARCDLPPLDHGCGTISSPGHREGSIELPITRHDRDQRGRSVRVSRTHSGFCAAKRPSDVRRRPTSQAVLTIKWRSSSIGRPHGDSSSRWRTMTEEWVQQAMVRLIVEGGGLSLPVKVGRVRHGLDRRIHRGRPDSSEDPPRTGQAVPARRERQRGYGPRSNGLAVARATSTIGVTV
jgi:hypothetical protein